ncbi:MAG: VCBS repeat-containing protein, partial [Acidobacteria bacterium]|nr:VCBS repeat-containing protein [Acidobacteriota bacterium]
GAIPGADEIFALGLRNPFRWSFDRGGSNQLWLGDVGQNNWEEVDTITNGGNYGWRVFEGNSCTNLGPDPCTPANYAPPVFVYSSQNTSSRCSVTGGYVYRGGQGALPDGAYIYGDYCTGEILVWHNGQQIPLHDIADFNLVSFGEDEDGELYVVQMGTGIIQKLVPAKASADFDGDARTDLTVFRPGNATWYTRNLVSGGFRTRQFGVTGDIPSSEDYDGDRVSDIAVYRPTEATWYYLLSSTSTFNAVSFGEPGDIPAAGDYDGDARADLAVFRPTSGQWHLRLTSGSGFVTYNWGITSDVPVPGDYDGDGRYDIAVWRPSNGTWYSINSTNRAFRIGQYGMANDIPSTGDFDGDGQNDLAVFRPSTGMWYQRRSNNTFVTVSWGANGDVPVVGDYDGDGRDDVAVFRPSSGTWYLKGSSAGFMPAANWGASGDIPVPSVDTP